MQDTTYLTPDQVRVINAHIAEAAGRIADKQAADRKAQDDTRDYFILAFDIPPELHEYLMTANPTSKGDWECNLLIPGMSPIALLGQRGTSWINRGGVKYVNEAGRWEYVLNLTDALYWADTVGPKPIPPSISNPMPPHVTALDFEQAYREMEAAYLDSRKLAGEKWRAKQTFETRRHERVMNGTIGGGNDLARRTSEREAMQEELDLVAQTEEADAQAETSYKLAKMEVARLGALMGFSGNPNDD